MPIDSLVRILGIVFGFGMPLLAIWTEYKRARALSVKGLHQAEKLKSPNTLGWVFLIGGSIVVLMGTALVDAAFLCHMGGASGVRGLVFLFVGIALQVVYFISKEKAITLKD